MKPVCLGTCILKGIKKERTSADVGVEPLISSSTTTRHNLQPPVHKADRNLIMAKRNGSLTSPRQIRPCKPQPGTHCICALAGYVAPNYGQINGDRPGESSKPAK
ncbi:hypothetical protein NW759_006776 [Fusarium solani]|nr:hypothetical protein NW759_006776 [Fusarium solani]